MSKKIEHNTSVDQSDRHVPYNLRQSGPTAVQMLISTRVRKSPYWHKSIEHGCWRATVYNRIYHPRGYVKPEDGGAMVEYEAIKNHVTMWNVAVERQIRVKGPDAEKFTDYVITRDATKISPMRARYVILCNYKGGVLNDPILLRISEDEFWFSLSDSDIGLYLQGVNADKRFNVEIDEIDACPVQIQGPKSLALMKDLIGDQVDLDNMPFYGLAEANVGGRSCVISQSGFSGEAGYEIYLRDATKYADDMWDAVVEAGKKT
jgi:aminomethyltransferase